MSPSLPPSALTPGHVVRHGGHGLHAAGHHHLVVAQGQALRGQHHGLHAGGAHLEEGREIGSQSSV